MSGTLYVQIIKGRELRNVEIIGKRMDPYVIIVYGDFKGKTTVCDRGHMTPAWNDPPFTIKVAAGVGAMGHALALQCLERNSMSKDTPIGSADTVKLDSVLAASGPRKQEDAVPQWVEIRAFNGKSAGDILVKMWFVPLDSNPAAVAPSRLKLMNPVAGTVTADSAGVWHPNTTVVSAPKPQSAPAPQSNPSPAPAPAPINVIPLPQHQTAPINAASLPQHQTGGSVSNVSQHTTGSSMYAQADTTAGQPNYAGWAPGTGSSVYAGGVYPPPATDAVPGAYPVSQPTPPAVVPMGSGGYNPLALSGAPPTAAVGMVGTGAGVYPPTSVYPPPAATAGGAYPLSAAATGGVYPPPAAAASSVYPPPLSVVPPPPPSGAGMSMYGGGGGGGAQQPMLTTSVYPPPPGYVYVPPGGSVTQTQPGMQQYPPLPPRR